MAGNTISTPGAADRRHPAVSSTCTIHRRSLCRYGAGSIAAGSYHRICTRRADRLAPRQKRLRADRRGFSVVGMHLQASAPCRRQMGAHLGDCRTRLCLCALRTCAQRMGTFHPACRSASLFDHLPGNRLIDRCQVGPRCQRTNDARVLHCVSGSLQPFSPTPSDRRQIVMQRPFRPSRHLCGLRDDRYAFLVRIPQPFCRRRRPC